MNIQNQSVLWYPCAWNDFRDLLFFHPEKAKELSIDILPDIYIHSDRNPLSRLEEGYLFKDARTVVEVLREEQINLFANFPFETTLFELRITSHKFGEFNRKLIYCVVDNFTFFRKVVLEHSLKITHLVTIRDGRSGIHKYLEYFLGLMGTKYLISDNYGRGRNNGNDFLEEVELQLIEDYFNSKENRPVLLNGISTLRWSDYGLFPEFELKDEVKLKTDAIVMKVVNFPTLMNSR